MCIYTWFLKLGLEGPRKPPSIHFHTVSPKQARAGLGYWITVDKRIYDHPVRRKPKRLLGLNIWLLARSQQRGRLRRIGSNERARHQRYTS